MDTEKEVGHGKVGSGSNLDVQKSETRVQLGVEHLEAYDVVEVSIKDRFFHGFRRFQ